MWMPTYEYACSACGHQWEQVQRIVEAPIEVCPKCAAAAAHRLISGGTNFILKGGGWYSDLYSSKAKAPDKPSDAGAAGSNTAGSSGEAKSDSTDKGETKTSTPSATPATPSTPSSSTPSS